MSVQINVQASQSALAQSISQGVAAYNARFASQNQLNLQINPRSFSQPLGRITSDLADFESALKASNARVLAFGASTAVLGGAVKTFKELANITIEIEKSLTDVNRVLGLSTSGLQKFSSELFTISKQTASSFDDATKAALEFSRQGLNTEETLKRTADALTLVRLTGISSKQAVEDLTSTINGFSKAGLTTAQVVNKLAAVEQDFAVSASDLTEALSRTGQAAQEAGVDFDQLNALVTTAQQSTARGGAVIGNALKTIFTRLQRTDTLDQLEKFNIIVRDVEGNILPAVQILQNFANKYNDLADAQRAQLSEQVAGVYQVNILKGIVNDLTNTQGTYTKALERGAKASNEADLANQKLNKTLSALATQTGLGLQQLANNVGKVTFAPIFEAIVSPVNDAVKYINDTLEGEGPGSIFANGLLKGIRNVITGPGLAIAFAVIAKVAKNTFEDATKALPAILGLTTEAQKRANIEKSILSILQGQSQLSMALQGQQGNEIAQAQTLLNFAKLQTAQYQQQLQLAQQLAPLLSAQGATVGARGIQVGPRIKAGGHIPAFAEMSERMGAAMGGYKAGKVIKAPSSVGSNTYMNTAEQTKYVSGFSQPFINPPARSKAGRAHRQNSISRTGIDPYMFSGFIPNFVNKKNQILLNKEIGRDFENKVGKDIGTPPSFNKAIDFASVPNIPSDPLKEYNKNFYSSQTFADAYSGTGHNAATNIGKIIRHLDLNYQKILNNPYSDNYFFDGKDLILDPNFTEIIGKGADQQIAIASSKASSLSPESKSVFLQGLNKKQQKKALNQKIVMEFAKDKVYGSGFIPNFATPMTTASIPWFKKYSSKYKNAAGDADLFKMGDFPTYRRGSDHEYAKKGNANMLSYLHEDFVRSALNIALGSKQVIRPSEVGFRDKPISDIANENDFDLLYRIADGSYSMLELKQDFRNISGSVTGFMNKKLANLEKENPVLAKKVSSMIAVSNRPKFTDPTGRNVGANFSEFEMAAASIVKDKYSNVDPSISAKLTKVTDGLLRRYEAKKNTTYDGFIPNFASRREMFRDLVKFNLESAPDNQNVLGGKTTLFRGVTNNKNSVFEQSRKHSQTENDRDYFRDTDINKIANDHVLEKKLLPFVSASTDKDIAEYFARGRRDDNLLGSGVVGSKTIKNSRIFSEQSIRKFTDKYGEKALKDIMLELSNWGSFGFGKGMAVNFQSFSQKKGFEGTDFAKEISFLSNGFIPNLANFIDVDTLSKNSVTYSGDLMKFIKDIEASIGRNLSSGELRFLTHPKTNLSKLNDPKVLNRFINSERKGGFAGFANGFVPNFNFIKGRNSFQKNWLIETAKKRNLNLNDPNTFTKLAAEFAKTYPNDQGMFGLSKGFIPNFAYKQAVMGLEESMSGNKAIFDTKSGPFPFIRNSSQSNFASAISDHGGLKNALNDSMRNQEAAGLMSKGFVPNFATLNAKQSLGMNFGALTGSEQKLFVELNKALSRLTKDINLTAQEQAILQNTVQQNAQALQQSTKSSTIVAEANNGLIKATQQNQNAQKKAAAASAASAAAALKPMPSRSVNPASINPNTISANRGGLMNSLSSMTNKLSGNVGFQIAVPMIAGQLESIIAQGRDRSEMSYGQRLGSTGVSAALTGASTGALIGSIIPGFGTALGAAVGAAVGFGGAMINARSNVDDFAKSIQNATQKDKEAENAVQGYTNSLKKLEEGGLTQKEREKTEKERQKYLLKIPAAIKAGINPNASSAEVEKTLEDLQISNDKREKVRNLQVLASSDLTKDQFDTARQTIAELSLVDKRFKNIADAITSSQTGEERAAFLAKGGGLEQQLSRSETFKSLKPEEQKQVIEGFRNAFAENTQGTIRASKLGTSMQDARQVAEEIKRTAPNNSAKKSASDIYLEIDKFLNSTAITLRQTLAEEEFADKFNELKTTFENSLVEGLISPLKSITAQTELKKSNLQNAYNREIKTANLDFTTKFADQIRSTPVLGSNPTVIQKLKDFTNKEGGATTAELEQFINEAPLMTIPPDTLQKIMKMISDQKALEKDKADNLSREKKNLDESGRQAILREELSRSANIRASQMGSAQMERNIILSGRQTASEIQQAREDRYLNDVSNFYNMGMQRQSELRIGYRETATARNIQTFNANQLETANTNVLDAERLRITNEIATANAANNKQLADSLRKSPLLNQINLENLKTLEQTISEQEKYVKSLNGQGEQFTAANNSLTQLKRIQADIINNTKRETELLKIRNEEERKRVRDAKSFSVGLSAGFDDINKERETFANDFGQKIPGLFRDGLVGAMDAALNKADDLESALMGVAASFLREIQGMMLRNIANNIVGSIGSSFSFGQPKSAIEAGQQRGGFIRAQKGMYISGGRTGDKNPALLEDGEYVLNRNAVKSLGGPRAIDQLNFNAFPRFATGGDPGTMSASVSMNEPFERLSMYGREQSPEFQNYVERLREEEAAREKKRAERKALLNQFIGTLISTGVSMGISSAVSAAKNSSMANANLKGATGSMSNGTTTQVTNFADAKSLIDSGGSVTLANGSVLTKSNFADGFSRSTFNEVAATRFAESGIKINSGSLFRKSSATLMGKDYANQSIKQSFANPAAAFNRSQSIYEFTPYKGKQQGGAIGFNQGGFLPYGSRLTDSIPAYLTGGEYVVNSKAVRKYGVGGLNRINSGVAKFQDGGMVGTETSSPSNTSNTANNNVSINITVNASGGKVGDQESDSNNEGTEGNAKELSNRIKAVVLDVITTEQRTGGLLDSTKKR